MATAAEPRPAELPLPGGRKDAKVKLHPLLTATTKGPPGWFLRDEGRFSTRKAFGFRVPKDTWFTAPIVAYLVEHPGAGRLLIDTGFHASIADSPPSNLGRFSIHDLQGHRHAPRAVGRGAASRQGHEGVRHPRSDHDPPPPRSRQRDRGLPRLDLPAVRPRVGGRGRRRAPRWLREVAVRPRLRLPPARLRFERSQLVLWLRALARRLRRRKRPSRVHARPHARPPLRGAADRERRGARGRRRDLHAPHARGGPAALRGAPTSICSAAPCARSASTSRRHRTPW